MRLATASSLPEAAEAFSSTCSSVLPICVSLALRLEIWVSMALSALRSSFAVVMRAWRSSVCFCVLLPVNPLKAFSMVHPWMSEVPAW